MRRLKRTEKKKTCREIGRKDGGRKRSKKWKNGKKGNKGEEKDRKDGKLGVTHWKARAV